MSLQKPESDSEDEAELPSAMKPVVLMSSDDIDDFAKSVYNEPRKRHVIDLAANHNTFRATRQKTEPAKDFFISDDSSAGEDPVDCWNDAYLNDEI